jgi:chromosome segregation ATPase
MSRWLNSVNSLLEQFDGQAQNVASGDFLLDGGAIGSLIEKAKTVTPLRRANIASSSASDEYYSTDDDDDYYDEEEDDENEEEEEDVEEEEEYYEEEVVSESGGAVGSQDDDIMSSSLEGENGPQQTRTKDPAAKGGGDDEEDAISIGIPAERKRLNAMGEIVDEDAVSDISCSEHMDEEKNSNTKKTTTPSTGNADDVNTYDDGEYFDVPPKTPSRQHSAKKNLLELTAAQTAGTGHHAEKLGIETAAQVPPPLTQHLSTAGVAAMKSPVSGDRSEKTDISPRVPRRSLHEVHTIIPDETVGLWSAQLDEEGEIGGVDSSVSANPDPPKVPTRQASHNTPPATAVTAQIQTLDTIGGGEDNNKTVNSKISDGGDIVESSKLKASTKKAEKSNDAALTVKVQALQAQVKKAKSDLKTSQDEGKKLEKTVKTLTAKLDTADAEINAQREELLRAGERMEKDRTRAQADREDLLDDHDEELEQIKEMQDAAMAELKAQYEKQIQDLKSRLETEESRRMQEGGDWSNELKDAIQREKDVLVRLNQIEGDKNALQSANSKLEMQQAALQTKVESSLAAAKTAAERERQAEDKLDATMSLHARQMSQRQAREAELEGTIFELGSALTLARQQQMATTSHSVSANTSPEETANFRDQYEQAKEELETVKVQFDMETQRREALQHELNEISKERTEEASSAQAKQRQHDRKVADLESTISRLQESMRGLKSSGNGGGGSASVQVSATTNDQVTQLLQQVDEYKLEVAQLSEQLLRQQDRVDACKTEILALKGRLEAASTRAEDAEKALYAAEPMSDLSSPPASTGRIYEMEGGGMGYSNPGVRRRVKGGSTRPRGAGSSSSASSIRSALRMTSGQTSPGMEQVAMTLDALDGWMVDTGSFLRREPLARLGFLLYLLILHLWSFALVIFHTTEQPHADFGSLGNNPRNWRPQTP